MGHLVNPCLKRTFTVFNVFFVIVGAGAIVLGLLFQFSALPNIKWGDFLAIRTLCIIALYVMGSIVMVIAIVGACGAHNESKASLIVFLAFMIIGSLVMLRTGIFVAIGKSEVERGVEEIARGLLPLDTNSDEVKNGTEAIQSELHCCGLFSYEDWEGHIPNSCLCTSKIEGQCQIVRDKSIYSKSCIPIIISSYITHNLNILMGVFFGLAALALMGLILSSTMIHQMRYISRPAIMVSVPAVFTSAPPKYKELYNYPGY